MTKKLIIIVSLFLLIGCIEDKKNVPSSFDFGVIEGHVYTNKFFKFKIAANPDWYILNKKELNNKIEEGARILDDVGNEKFKEEIEASMVNLANLFGVYKKELGTTLNFNPSISVNAENLSVHGTNLTSKDYLQASKEFMLNSGMNIVFTNENIFQTIGNKEFITVNLDNNTFGETIKQEYYSTIINNFALNVILSYVEESDKEELHKMLHTLKFYK